ncbi:hypothetical protein ACJX0J_040468, partial [Zea mays]
VVGRLLGAGASLTPFGRRLVKLISYLEDGALQMMDMAAISISENVIPAYRAFTGRYGSLYTPEDLENHLDVHVLFFSVQDILILYYRTCYKFSVSDSHIA